MGFISGCVSNSSGGTAQNASTILPATESMDRFLAASCHCVDIGAIYFDHKMALTSQYLKISAAPSLFIIGFLVQLMYRNCSRFAQPAETKLEAGG